MSGSERVLLYSRAGCHLCDQARPVVRAVCAETGESVREVDIDADPALRREYTDKVPVVAVDGVVVDFWWVDADRLRARLLGDAGPGARPGGGRRRPG